MEKYILIIPAIILFHLEIKISQYEGIRFIIQFGELTVCWILFAIASFVFKIPLLISIIFLVRAVSYSIIFIHGVNKLYKFI